MDDMTYVCTHVNVLFLGLGTLQIKDISDNTALKHKGRKIVIVCQKLRLKKDERIIPVFSYFDQGKLPNKLPTRIQNSTNYFLQDIKSSFQSQRIRFYYKLILRYLSSLQNCHTNLHLSQ